MPVRAVRGRDRRDDADVDPDVEALDELGRLAPAAPERPAGADQHGVPGRAAERGQRDEARRSASRSGPPGRTRRCARPGSCGRTARAWTRGASNQSSARSRRRSSRRRMRPWRSSSGRPPRRPSAYRTSAPATEPTVAAARRGGSRSRPTPRASPRAAAAARTGSAGTGSRAGSAGRAAHSRRPAADPPPSPSPPRVAAAAHGPGRTLSHLTAFSRDAEATRAFFRDVLELDSVDAGGGWLIFALPPAELGVHPTDGDAAHALYLMCDDLDATLAELRGQGRRARAAGRRRGLRPGRLPRRPRARRARPLRAAPPDRPR